MQEIERKVYEKANLNMPSDEENNKQASES
jgi:hypothetical protein